MPRPGPRKEIVRVRLAPETIVALDRAAGAEGVNRSEFVRDVIVKTLKRRRVENGNG